MTPEHIVLLLTALIFGAIGFVGMILTPMLIWRFPDGEAAEVLQPVLPVFYGVNGGLALLGAIISYGRMPLAAGVLGIIVLGYLYQILWLHWRIRKAWVSRDIDRTQIVTSRTLVAQSLVLNLVQWLLSGWVIVGLPS